MTIDNQALDAGDLNRSESGGASEGVWISVKDVVGILHISRSTVYSLIRKGKIPIVHVGRQTRINKNVLDELIESGALKL